MEMPKIWPKGSPEKKLSWLRSQIIGATAEFNSPFGNRPITYADSSATARSLRFIEDYILHNVLPCYGNTHTSDSYVGKQSTKMVEQASHYIKRCMGGGEDDAILFCGSGSTSAIKRLQEVMGITIPSNLRARVSELILREEERWVVFVGPYEHHSNLLSWRQSLAEVVEIGLSEDGGSLDLEGLRTQLEYYALSNRPMLGSFSACSNVTGIVTGTRALATLLHRYGAFACFDFATSAPYVEINMRSGEVDGYDAVFISPHKFIGGPGSPGILLMRKNLYQLTSSAPSTCGGGTVSYVNGFSEEDTLYSENIEERESAGTPPIIQTVRAALAFWVKEYIGYKTIAEHEHKYMERALEKLGKIKNIEILGNNINVKRLPIVSFLIYPATNINNGSVNDLEERREKKVDEKEKPLHGRFVAKLLNDLFGIQARGGCACAGPYGHHLLHVDKAYSLAFRSSIQQGYEGVKPAWTRISFPYYMSNEEFDFVLGAVKFVADYGHCILPFYDFNWRNGDWRLNQKAFTEALDRAKKSIEISNNVDLLKLANLVQQLNLRCKTSEDRENEDDKDTISIDIDTNTNKDKGLTKNKYTPYLEEAAYIAYLLTEFPEQPKRRVPEDLLLDLPFKV